MLWWREDREPRHGVISTATVPAFGTSIAGYGMTNGERIGQAYEAVAADYNRQLEPARSIRRALWRHFDRLFGPGDRILDIGCGTGTDAIHLARNHVRVTAVDASAEMLARLHAKLARESPRLQEDVDVQRGNVDDVGATLVGPFDGIISSFAALNTVDLSTFARHAARLLRPGGRFVCHMLSTGHGQSAWTRLLGRPAPRGAPGARTVVVGGEPLTHLDVAPDEIFAASSGRTSTHGAATRWACSSAAPWRLDCRSRSSISSDTSSRSSAPCRRWRRGAVSSCWIWSGAVGDHAGRVAQRSSGFTTPGQTAAP